MIIDFHTHSKREKDDILEVVSIHPNRKKPCNWYTIGYHPWWIGGQLSDEELDVLKDKLENDEYCLGLGECGLDKLKGVSLQAQEIAFIQQIELANELNAPVIVHCVRVYDTLLKLHKKYAKTPWVVHGYRRNKTLAKSILDKGIYLSVAPSDYMQPTFIEMLEQLPMTQFFIETDSDTSMKISDRYKLLASIKKLDICELEEQILTNFKTFFGWKYRG